MCLAQGPQRSNAGEDFDDKFFFDAIFPLGLITSGNTFFFKKKIEVN